MGLAEVLAATLAAFLASVSVVPSVMDACGIGLMPPVVLALSMAMGGTVAWRLLKSVGGWRGPDHHLRQGSDGQEAGRLSQECVCVISVNLRPSPAALSS